MKAKIATRKFPNKKFGDFKVIQIDDQRAEVWLDKNTSVLVRANTLTSNLPPTKSNAKGEFYVRLV